jgi:hypothetical protein
MASRNSAVNWPVKALVEATPISGPACVMIVPEASRVIMEPTTLQIASVFDPFCLASRCAASVSAVSPDCEITTVSVSGPRSDRDSGTHCRNRPRPEGAPAARS